jgi:hypothetical protein
MDSNREHLNNLSEIRQLMERSSSFLSLSGLSGISAGVIGIITTVILDYKLGAFLSYQKDVSLTAERRTGFIVFCVILFTAVLAVTFGAAIYFTTRKAKKKGLPIWGPAARNLTQNLFVPLIAGGIFCIILVYNYFDFLVLPSMLVFYGLALINAGKFTFGELKWLGISEILIGLAALLLLDNVLWFWGLGFGVMNIVYGAVMYFRYER